MTKRWIKKQKALAEWELQDVQILLLLKCVQLWAQSPQEKDSINE